MRVRVKIDGRAFEVEIDNLRNRPIVATVDGERFEVWPEERIPAPLPADPGADAALTTPTPAAREPTTTVAANASRAVRAPLPGMIVSLTAQPGSMVTVGQELCVLEAMKMKNPVRATRAGQIAAVHVTIGQHVKHHDLLLEYAD
jgi:biotin carboxyl carrier protein